jgi:hypothetical protein
MARSSHGSEGDAPSVAPTEGTSDSSDHNGGGEIGEKRMGETEYVNEAMPTRRDVVMELLRRKKIRVTEVRGALENLTETIEEMLGRLEDEGELDKDEGAEILLKLLTETDMPTSVNVVDRGATSGLSLSSSSQFSSQQETRSRVQAETTMNSQTSRRDQKKPERDIAKVFNERVWPHFKLLFNDRDMEIDSPIAQIYFQQIKLTSACNRTAAWKTAKKVGLQVLRRKRSSVASYMKETFIGKKNR